MKNRIREVRSYFQLSRKDFGARMYVSQDVINNVERGRVEPTGMFIKCLCDEFGVCEGWLRSGKGDMFFSESKEGSLRERIREIRIHNHLTQAEFGVSLGLAPTSAASWEKKSNPQLPTESMRILICEKFGINRNWLESGEGNMLAEEHDTTRAMLDQIQKNSMVKCLLEAYVNLTDDHREVIDDYVADFVNRYSKVQRQKHEK